MEDNKTNVVEVDNNESNKNKKIGTYYDSVLNNFSEKGVLPLWSNYNAVAKFKSVRRAIRRGHVDLFTGVIYPSKPFNNRKPTRGRKINNLKKQIYEQLKTRVQ